VSNTRSPIPWSPTVPAAPAGNLLNLLFFGRSLSGWMFDLPTGHKLYNGLSEGQ